MPHLFAETPLAALRQKEGVVPLLAFVVLLLSWGSYFSTGVYLALMVILAMAVLSAVHHAEVIAARLGDPLGSIVLAIAVTIIEVGLIIMLMISGKGQNHTLLRDTIFAVVIITLNIVVGLSIFESTKKGKLGYFNTEGASTALASVLTLSVLTMVLPRFTTSSPRPIFSPSQLFFAGIASLVIYTAFIATQTRRHREFFMPINAEGRILSAKTSTKPSKKVALTSLVLLLFSLVAVVGLAKVVSPVLEKTVSFLGLPHSFVGVLIALMVLSPETLAAYNASKRGKLMEGLNLAYGSSLASIGLTIPTMMVANIWLNMEFELGLTSTQIVLLAISALASVLTIIPGRATRQEGIIHLVIGATYIFLAMVP